MLRGGNALDVGPQPNYIGTIADQIVKRCSALADASRPTN